MSFALTLCHRHTAGPQFSTGGPCLSLGNVIRANILHQRKYALGGAVLLMVLVIVMAGQATAKLVKEKGTAANAPRAIFGQIAVAWEEGDEQALADLIHADGLQVTTGRSGERTSHYSPSQAYYYFRNVFQSHRTLLFEFEMMQDATAGVRVHGMATWKRRRPDSENIQVVKLVCVLIQQDEQWKLAEINTIR